VTSERAGTLGALAALAALFGALVAWSFGTWTDPVIDFGFELYVPWRLVEGDVLYRDIAYRNGPLSPYFNAFVFGTLGVGVRSLVAANLAIFAAIALLLYAALARATSRLGAAAGVALLLCVCGFSQYGTVGNYDFATPYQHGQTHGLLLGLACVGLLARALRRHSFASFAIAGAFLGGLALTKAEMLAPAAVAAGLAVARARAGDRGRAAASLLLPALAVFACAVALLALELGPEQALRGALGNWVYLVGVASDGFYAGTSGLDAPGRNALAMLGACAAATAAAALLATIDRLPRRFALGVASAASAAALAAGALLRTPWPQLARALPIATLIVLALALRAHRRARAERDECSAGVAIERALLAAYALVLLAKLGLHPQVQHYGFALAAPALALAVAAGLAALRTPAARACALAFVATIAVAALRDANEILAHKTFLLGEGADRILVAGPDASPRGTMIESALRELDARMGEDSTLLVLPEGAGLNYWLRRRNPTPYALFLPTEQRAHGGADAMLARIEASPPDFVALVHRGHAEFGTGPFLRDPENGQAFLPWLERDYRIVWTIGAEPFRGPRFGIALLERIESEGRR